MGYFKKKKTHHTLFLVIFNAFGTSECIFMKIDSLDYSNSQVGIIFLSLVLHAFALFSLLSTFFNFFHVLYCNSQNIGSYAQSYFFHWFYTHLLYFHCILLSFLLSTYFIAIVKTLVHMQLCIQAQVNPIHC